MMSAILNKPAARHSGVRIETVDNWHKSWPRVLAALTRRGARKNLLVESDGWLSARQIVLAAFAGDVVVGFLCFHIEPGLRGAINAHGDLNDVAPSFARLGIDNARASGGDRQGAGFELRGTHWLWCDMSGMLVQLNISDGGMPKLPVAAAQVTRCGVAGDRQRNLKYHGGPDRAVCLFSHELYEWLREKGIDLAYGSVGENFTTRGIDLNSLDKGRRLRVGECMIEITAVRVPCSNLKKFDPDLPELIVGRSGWVARVVEEAVVKPGDEVVVLEHSSLTGHR